MDNKSLYTTLVDTAERFPDKIGVADENESITYRTLLDRVNNLSAYFVEKVKLHRGSRIAVMMLNSIQYITTVYAAAKEGIEVVLINVKLHAKEIAYILNDTESEGLVLQRTLWENIASELPDTQVGKLIWDYENIPDGTDSFEHYSIQAGEEYRGDHSNMSATKATDVMAVLYTSGTSGDPKGVEITHRAILETVISYQAMLKLDSEQRTLLAVPLFHVTGFSCIMALFIYIGGLMKILPSFHSRQSLQIITDSRITHFHAVPTIYQMLVNVMDEKKYDLSSLETAACGGGYIHDRLIEQFCSIAPNVTFHPAYGMTETAGGGVLFPEKYPGDGKNGAAGKKMDNCEIAIIDDKGCEVPTGGIGQIAFCGPIVINHYLNHKSDNSFIGRWLLTGDVGKIDEDGYVYVVGRLKSMINRGGEKVYSRFVERAICAHPKVSECMVFPVKDFLYGEVPGCVIIPYTNEEITETEIRNFLSERIQKNEIPQYIEFWDKLPSTASGKVKIGYLTELFNKKYYKEGSATE